MERQMDGRMDGEIDRHGQTYIPPPSTEDKEGSNSVNTVDRVMILAFCTSADCPLSMYQVSFNSLVIPRRRRRDIGLSMSVHPSFRSHY